jgi:hypothetical protein
MVPKKEKFVRGLHTLSHFARALAGGSAAPSPPRLVIRTLTILEPTIRTLIIAAQTIRTLTIRTLTLRALTMLQRSTWPAGRAQRWSRLDVSPR